MGLLTQRAGGVLLCPRHPPQAYPALDSGSWNRGREKVAARGHWSWRIGEGPSIWRQSGLWGMSSCGAHTPMSLQQGPTPFGESEQNCFNTFWPCSTTLGAYFQPCGIMWIGSSKTKAMLMWDWCQSLAAVFDTGGHGTWCVLKHPLAIVWSVSNVG